MGQHPILIFNLRTAAFETYRAIWVRRSNFRHQASPRVSPCESTQRWKVELWARNVREFCLNADFHVTFRDLLHAVKLRHGTNGFTSSLKEGVLRIFFALKIGRLRPGKNPRTWIPKASTLPLDHRSRCSTFYLVDFFVLPILWLNANVKMKSMILCNFVAHGATSYHMNAVMFQTVFH